jgi:predicted ester cyclase
MHWTHFLSTLSLLYLSSTTASPLFCTSPTSPAYEQDVATNDAKFHQNFNKGEAGKKANGALASVSIDWAANNQHFLGREAFVSGLLSFSTAFSPLQIHDQITIQEGNTAAILYFFDGVNSGQYNGHPVSHANVKAWNGEFMLFDQDVLLNQLITINELDSLELQVTGQQKATTIQNITLGTNKPTQPPFRTNLKNTAAQFTAHFNAHNLTGLQSLCIANVAVHTSSNTTHGPSAVSALLNKYHTPFPDLLAHDEFIIADGHMASVETIIEGTHTGAFTASNGTVVPADGKMYRIRVMRWYQFTDQGLVNTIWEVNNRNDLVVNTMG